MIVCINDHPDWILNHFREKSLHMCVREFLYALIEWGMSVSTVGDTIQWAWNSGLYKKKMSLAPALYL